MSKTKTPPVDCVINGERVLSRDALCELLQIPDTGVKREKHRRKLVAHRIGNRDFFLGSEVLDWIRRCDSVADAGGVMAGPASGSTF